MSRPILLDLFCGAGGAARGYQQAGFYVVGVDHKPQPRYVGDEFFRDDVFAFLRMCEAEYAGWKLRDFDAIHASPPCQASSRTKSRWPDREHPELIPPIRELLIVTGLPYVIENVVGAKLVNPVTLCGQAFGLGIDGHDLWRHRLFECSFPALSTPCVHRGQPIGVYGHGSAKGGSRGFQGLADEKREAMGTPWMTGNECSQAIPPAFTEFIGGFLLAEAQRRAEVAA